MNQYTNIGGQPIAYDTNGNLTNDGSTIYAYDMENRLVSTSGSAASNFKYDPLGRLHEVTIAGNTTRFLYDGDALVAEYNSSGALTRRYLHGDQIDEPWVQYYGPNLNYERRFLYADHQGSIIAHSNYMGTLSNSLTYDAYGIPGSANLDRFGYTGQIWFKELGLFHYKARMYHPKLGRFLQTDPIFYADNMNMYAYVGNDPVNMTDPTGMYGRGEGWTEKQWKQFDKAQKAAAGKMESKATSLEKQAAKLDKKGKEGGDNLRTAASNLRDGAKALRSDGSDGKLAYAGSTDSGTWTRKENVAAFVNGAGGNTMVVNLRHDVFKAGGNILSRELTHESLHTAGLSDWTRGQRAYCCSGQDEYLNHYNSLTQEEKVNNPDYLKELVW